MSVRPRPVTGTFRHQYLDFDPEIIPRLRQTSLSSGSSTASLCSVLYHDSCESLSDAELNPKKSSQITERKECSSNSPTKFRSRSVNSQLTSWETWLLNKTKLSRELLKKELENAELQRAKREAEEKKKEEQKKKAQIKYQNWVEEKNAVHKRKKLIEKRKADLCTKLEQQKAEQIQEKSKLKFEEWKLAKLEKMKANKKVTEQKKIEKEKEKQIKEAKNLESYEKWLNEAKNRPKLNKSHSVVNGKLINCIDSNVAAPPSFYNPLPWQPIAIPSVPSRKHKKLKKKKSVNIFVK